MGVHTGEATEEAVGLVGLEVNRAARIAAVGHGGQVLVSSATAALLRDSLPDGAQLRDLGAHRLKDLGRAEQIFQLEADGLLMKFPPLMSLDNPELGNNLPVQLTSFIGRELELGQIRALVKESRLVTLTGSGGIGKTRLALHAAAELVDGSGNGVWFVDLAPLSDPDLVAASIAMAVGVSEERGRPLSETLIDALQDRSLLVVLDNCEHVIDACAKLADALLRSCPRVHILATSREPLAIGGERVYRVPSLTLPTETADYDMAMTAESDALRLFADRAREHRPDFVLNEANVVGVVSVCRRLDGIPLAIELAAARLRSLALSDVEARLDQRFRLLTGGGRMALPRQQTLRAMVDWSYELLPSRERALLRRVSVFAGGWTLDAAETVCHSDDIERWEVVDLLGSLVDKSLVQAEPTGETLRYRMLETIRQYAAEQLSMCDESEIASVREKQAEVFLTMAETAAPHIRGALQQEWLARLGQEHDNLRTAFRYFTETPSAIEKALRLGVALEYFWEFRGLYGEGADLLAAALDTPEAAHPTAVRAAALKTAGSLLMYRDGPRAASARFDEGLAIAQRLGDPGLTSDHLSNIAFAQFFQGDQAGALELVEEGLRLAREIADTRRLTNLLRRRAVFVSAEDPDQARADLGEAFGHAGEDKILVAAILGELGLVELGAGNLDVARTSLEEVLALHLELHDDEIVVEDLQSLCLTALLQEDVAAAVRFSTDALRRCGADGNTRLLCYSFLDAALCASALDEHERAVRLHGAADALIEQRSEVFQPIEAGVRERDHISLRQAMSESVFAVAYEAGRSLSRTDATSLALETTMSRKD
jgi:predicted ATPase